MLFFVWLGCLDSEPTECKLDPSQAVFPNGVSLFRNRRRAIKPNVANYGVYRVPIIVTGQRVSLPF